MTAAMMVTLLYEAGLPRAMCERFHSQVMASRRAKLKEGDSVSLRYRLTTFLFCHLTRGIFFLLV